MIEPGKIRIIDNKILFEPDGLEKPKEKDYNWSRESKCLEYDCLYAIAMKEYEASKQLIEVSNKGYFRKLNINGENRIVFNNQKCKAEITNNTATIVELTKE